MSNEPFRLRNATPSDLPQLEAWCFHHRPDESPPYVAVTLSEFVATPSRGFLLIVVDGTDERGFVVVSRLWSNRLRTEIAVIDDCMVDDATDPDLLRHEIQRFIGMCGIDRVVARGENGALDSI